MARNRSNSMDLFIEDSRRVDKTNIKSFSYTKPSTRYISLRNSDTCNSRNLVKQPEFVLNFVLRRKMMTPLQLDECDRTVEELLSRYKPSKHLLRKRRSLPFRAKINDIKRLKVINYYNLGYRPKNISPLVNLPAQTISSIIKVFKTENRIIRKKPKRKSKLGALEKQFIQQFYSVRENCSKD